MKSNSASMQALFDLLAEEFKEQLQEGKKVMNKDGELERVSPDAATLSAIRQFLKDNNISVVPGTNEAVNDIAKSLPFVDDEDGDITRLQ